MTLTWIFISDNEGTTTNSLLSQKETSGKSMKKTTDRPVTYNLMEEKYGSNWKKDRYFSVDKCNLEYANRRQLQQDHPCVIQLIRDNYLRQPSPRSTPYNLSDWPRKYDPSDGQSQAILRLLQDKTNGFFIEAGAHDGEYLSNTVYMERFLNWTGLLVEAYDESFKILMGRNRKAYAVPTCLSTKPYPIEVSFDATHSEASYIIETNQQETMKNNQQQPISNNSSNAIIQKVQCFPLYSILLAIGRTKIDFFSLDVEGAEYKILSTIPWNKVDISVLSVEWNHIPEGEPAMTQLMENNKFIKFGFIKLEASSDVVYMKDVLADYRVLLYDDDDE